MKKIIFLGFLIRFLVILLSLNLTNFDLNSYLKVGQITLQGINIYPETARVHHPYFPFFLYLEAMAIYLKQININPILFIKTIIILFDSGIIYLIYLLSNKNLKSALSYALNPIVILITSLHGQFDSIPLFFILLAIYLIAKKHESITFLFLSLAIMLKTWPLFFILPFLKKVKRKIIWLMLAIFPISSLLLYSLLFKAKIFDIVKIIFNHHSLFGTFGLGKIVFLIYSYLGAQTSILEERVFFVFFACSFILFCILNKKGSLLQELLLLILFFYSFTTNFAVQYFLWCIPFLILIRPKHWFLLNILIAFYLGFYYLSWYLPNNFTNILTVIGLAIWIIFLKMFVDMRKKTLI